MSDCEIMLRDFVIWQNGFFCGVGLTAASFLILLSIVLCFVRDFRKWAAAKLRRADDGQSDPMDDLPQ